MADSNRVSGVDIWGRRSGRQEYLREVVRERVDRRRAADWRRNVAFFRGNPSVGRATFAQSNLEVDMSHDNTLERWDRSRPLRAERWWETEIAWYAKFKGLKGIYNVMPNGMLYHQGTVDVVWMDNRPTLFRRSKVPPSWWPSEVHPDLRVSEGL